MFCRQTFNGFWVVEWNLGFLSPSATDFRTMTAQQSKNAEAALTDPADDPDDPDDPASLERVPREIHPVWLNWTPWNFDINVPHTYRQMDILDSWDSCRNEEMRLVWLRLSEPRGVEAHKSIQYRLHTATWRQDEGSRGGYRRPSFTITPSGSAL